jgi:hypothetical protein
MTTREKMASARYLLYPAVPIEHCAEVSTKPVDFYDPSKESKWTRWGFSPESFKRAPGTTGGQVIHGDHAQATALDK